MRIAVIACSSYAACQKLTELPSAEAEVDLLGQRLQEPDAGFVVYSFRAERGLPEAVEQVLSEATEPVEELLFYFAGYAVLNDERGPALLLDGERLGAYSLKRLRRVLAERARRSLAVLDTIPAFDGETSPRDAVATLGTALADPNSPVHLVASVRPESAAFERSPFASLFELVLDWQSVSGSPVRIDGLYAAMRAEEALFANVPAAEYFPGSEPFELLRPAPTPMWSEPPSFTDQSSPGAERDEVTPVRSRPPPPIIEAAPPPVIEAGPPPVIEAGPPPIIEAGPPPVIEAGPPPVIEAGPPPSAEVAAQPVVRTGPPPLPRSAPAEAPVAKAPATPAEERELALESLTASMAEGRHGDAVVHARTALRIEPRDFETYRTLHMLFEKLGRPDGSWNVACVLDSAGAADVNESLLAGLHRPEGLIAAKGVLGDDDWRKKLLYPERDTTLDALFSSLGDALIHVGVETAQRKRRIPALPPESEQDPQKSTTTLARTLLWAARLLGVPTPKLYVVDALAGELGVAGTFEPVAIASKALGSGLSLPELAFLWARRLVLFRPEHRIVTLLPNAAELEDFVRAAQTLGAASDRSFKRLEGDQKLFGRGLKRHLRGTDRGPFEAAAKNVSKRTIGESVAAFRRSVELASGRAGLLASGDLSLALRMTERFPQHGALTPDEQSADLFTYSVSDEYAALRERLGVAVRG